MNAQWYHEDTLLLMLYSLQSTSTTELESFFADRHPQYANNVISNRYNSTSHFVHGLLEYDEASQVVSITDAGRAEVQRRYEGRRD